MRSFITARILVRHALVGMLMCGAIRVNMRVSSGLMVNMRGNNIFEAMRGIVSERNSGMGRKDAEAIKQRQDERSLDPKSSGNACQHRAFEVGPPNLSESSGLSQD